jgi:hypothetical protein
MAAPSWRVRRTFPTVTSCLGRIARPPREAALLLLAVLAGCGTSGGTIAQTYPVKGRVLLSSGKPLTAGRVAFVPKDVQTPPASGPIGPDGSFTLTTKSDGDGAAVGEYKVRIEPDANKAGRRQNRRPGFPLKYVDEDSSGLAITVRAESNHLEPIQLR